jgi:tetratricopeptide (TPR) repeat protein
VEGTLRRSGTGLRVTAELITVASGTASWSDTFSGEVKDIFRVQDSIATSVAGALKVKLGATERAALENAGTSSVKAHDLYRQASFFREKNNERDLRKAISLYEQASAKDPKYAAPLSGMALAYFRLADDYLSPREAYPKMKAAALRALALDSLDADAHDMLGEVYLQYEWQFAQGEQEFRRGLALDARSVDGHVALVWALMNRGAVDSAIAEGRAATEADPLSLYALNVLTNALTSVNRLDSAEVVIHRMHDIDPGYSSSHGLLGILRSRRRKYAEALSELALGDTTATCSIMMMAQCEAWLGRQEEARRRLAGLEAARKTHYVAGTYIAQVYAALGDRDATFRWMDVALSERSGDFTFLWYWWFDPIRSDPRFKALEAKVHTGIPP